jgi:hypothetical protein
LYSGVEITAYNQHVRLLPARALVVSRYQDYSRWQGADVVMQSG